MKIKILLIILFSTLFLNVKGNNVENQATSCDIREVTEELLQNPIFHNLFSDAASYEGLPFEINNDSIAERLFSLTIRYISLISSGNFTHSFDEINNTGKLLEREYEQSKDILSNNSYCRFFCPFCLAMLKSFACDYQSTISYLNETLDFLSSFENSYKSYEYLLTKSVFAETYTEMDRIDLAIKEFESVHNLYIQNGLQDSPYYYFSLYMLAHAYYMADDYPKTIDALEQFLKYLKEKNAEKNFLGISAMFSLVSSYAFMSIQEDSTKLIDALDQMVNIYEILSETEINDPEIILGLYHTELILQLALANAEDETPENESQFTTEIYNIIGNIISTTKSIIANKMPLMTESERLQYWKNDFGPIYLELLPFFTDCFGSGPMSYYMYNALLQSKGIQLNFNNAFNNYLTTTQDINVRERYDRLVALKATYNKEKNGSDYSNGNCKLLKKQIESMEYELLNTLKGGEYNLAKWMDVEVDDIQKILKDNEIAVELFECSIDDIPSYAALVLSNEPYAPTYVPICSISEFLIQKENPELLGEVFWSAILKLYPTTTKIFFAPCGEICNFPIELCVTSPNLPGNLTPVRLSSTRELVFNHDCTSTDYVFFGGLNYNQSLETTINETIKWDKSLNISIGNICNDLYQTDHTGIFHLLPGSLSEVNAISQYIPSSTNVSTIIGNQGVELAFKNLSNSKNRVIHIATHGYFQNFGNNPNTAMDNCGLVFAGVNSLEAIDEIPDFLDNGKLTASEIANMNLHGTDLVVLSACSSGLSNISSDGAFGLQRGLKLAGVNSIMMSLWDIPDNGPTQLMMSSFYKHYIETSNKLLAYQSAINEVKSKYPSFRDWASFVIIDAL